MPDGRVLSKVIYKRVMRVSLQIAFQKLVDNVEEYAHIIRYSVL